MSIPLKGGKLQNGISQFSLTHPKPDLLNPLSDNGCVYQLFEGLLFDVQSLEEIRGNLLTKDLRIVLEQLLVPAVEFCPCNIPAADLGNNRFLLALHPSHSPEDKNRNNQYQKDLDKPRGSMGPHILQHTATSL